MGGTTADGVAGRRFLEDNSVAAKGPVAINPIPGTAVRYASLDAVRGIAAFSVLLFHTNWPSHPTLLAFSRNCYTFVDLFFLLSGFVIAASYHNRVATSDQIATFFKRRIFRLYPLHWAILAFLASIELLKLFAQFRGGHLVGATHDAFTGAKDARQLIVNMFLLQGVGLFPHPSWNPPAWSVSAELVAYVLFAAAGYFGLLRKYFFVTGIAILGLAIYAVLAYRFGSLDLTSDYGIARCLAGFPIGVAIYQLASNGWFDCLERLSPRVLSALEAFVVLGLFYVLEMAQGGRIWFILPVFIALLVLFQLEGGSLSQALRSRPFQFLGAASYSIYLIHVPIRNLLVNLAERLGAPVQSAVAGQTILKITPMEGDALLLLFVMLTLIGAVLTFRTIEEPARLFGRRISVSDRP